MNFYGTFCKLGGELAESLCIWDDVTKWYKEKVKSKRSITMFRKVKDFHQSMKKCAGNFKGKMGWGLNLKMKV